MVCQCASRCLLITVNTIFVVIAVICAIVGGFFAWNIGVIHTLLRDHVYPKMDEMANSEQIQMAVERIIKMLSPFGLTIFIFGIILFLLCTLGLAGACLNSRCLITLYLILHGLVLIAEIILVIIYLARPSIITNNAQAMLMNSVNNYVSFNSTDPDSSLLTFLMPGLHCCGARNGSDFDNSKSFKRDITYDGQKITLKYPVPCCKFDSNRKPVKNCPAEFTVHNSNINYGCWYKLQAEVDRYGHIVAYTCVGVIGLQVLLVIASLVLVCRKDKSPDF